MTLHVLRRPFSLDPLMGEAKRRMQRRRKAMVIVVLLLAGGIVGTVLALRSPSPSPSPPGYGDASHSGGWTLARFPSFGVSFRYPRMWNRMDCRSDSSFTMSITYLASVPLGSCPTTSAAIRNLDASGVLVWWWNYGFPGRTQRISNFTGQEIEVGGRPARIAVSSPQVVGAGWVPSMCAQIGADRLVDVAIQRPASASGNWLMMSSCLRGPRVASGEATIRQILATVRFTR